MTEFVLAAVLGTLFALGTYLVLRRDVVRVVWGVTIISQSANVYLVTMGGLDGVAPIGHGHGGGEGVVVTDPLVQALVLTAIVIGFGTTALALVLTYRVYESHGTIDVYDLGGDGRASPDAAGLDAPDPADADAAGPTGTDRTDGTGPVETDGGRDAAAGEGHVDGKGHVGGEGHVGEDEPVGGDSHARGRASGGDGA